MADKFEPLRAPADIKTQIKNLRVLAMRSMDSGSAGLNFMQAARNFFLGNASKLAAAFDLEDVQEKIAELPSDATITQKAANFMFEVTRGGEYSACLIVFYNQATDAVSGMSTLKNYDDIATNIGILQAYQNTLRQIAATAKTSEKKAIQ